MSRGSNAHIAVPVQDYLCMLIKRQSTAVLCPSAGIMTH